MKTILFVDHTARLGGGEIALLNLAAALDPAHFRPVVALAEDGPLVQRLRDAGVETHVFPLAPYIVGTRKEELEVPSLLRFGTITRVAGYALTLAHWARTHGVDLIHANSLKADLYGGLAGRIARIPVIWHVRDHIDGLYLPPAAAGAFRGLARSVPNAVIANSESTLRRLHLPADTPAAVVYSGVPLSRFVSDTHPPIGAGRPVVTLVGRLAPWKGQDVFLRAAARVLRRHPGARFRIVGSPLFGEHDYAQSLHRLAGELGIEEFVEFMGFRDDVIGLLAETDVVAHASTLGEPFGQVVVEGMAAGRPVVATDGGAIPEIVVHDETGLLVPPGDDEAMAHALGSLLADPVRRQRMGAAGSRRARERFTVERTAATVHSVYSYLLSPASEEA